MEIFKEIENIDNDNLCKYYMIVDRHTLGKVYLEIKCRIYLLKHGNALNNKVIYSINDDILQTDNIVRLLRSILGIPNKMIFKILDISTLSCTISNNKLIKSLYFIQLFLISGADKNIGSLTFSNLKVKDQYELFSLFDILCDDIINLDIINFALQSIVISQTNFKYQSDKCKGKSENEITLFDLTRHT